MLEDKLRSIIQSNLSVVLSYDPYERFEGVGDRAAFAELIGNDPAFAPFFLSNPKYVTARIGGNLVTSLHRKLGDMYEEMFRVLLSERLKVPAEDLAYGVFLNVDGKLQKRSTDGLIRYATLAPKYRGRIKRLGKTKRAIGMAFEVRSCYQIGDSKRIQADRDMALALRRENIEPMLVIFCGSSLTSPVKRLSEYWNVSEGTAAFDLVGALTGFDLYGFLKSEGPMIRGYVERIFEMM